MQPVGRARASSSRRAAEVPMKLRRRQSDARWRANVASCYETLKNIIPMNKRASKRQISKALILQETAKHIAFLENILMTLLQEKAKLSGSESVNEVCIRRVQAIKEEFIAKQKHRIDSLNCERRYKKNRYKLFIADNLVHNNNVCPRGPVTQYHSTTATRVSAPDILSRDAPGETRVDLVENPSQAWCLSEDQLQLVPVQTQDELLDLEEVVVTSTPENQEPCDTLMYLTGSDVAFTADHAEDGEGLLEGGEGAPGSTPGGNSPPRASLTEHVVPASRRRIDESNAHCVPDLDATAHDLTGTGLILCSGDFVSGRPYDPLSTETVVHAAGDCEYEPQDAVSPSILYSYHPSWERPEPSPLLATPQRSPSCSSRISSGFTPVKLPPLLTDRTPVKTSVLQGIPSSIGKSDVNNDSELEDVWETSNLLCDEAMWLSDDEDPLQDWCQKNEQTPGLQERSFSVHKDILRGMKRKKLHPSSHNKRRKIQEETVEKTKCLKNDVKDEHPRCRRSLDMSFPDELESPGRTSGCHDGVESPASDFDGFMMYYKQMVGKVKSEPCIGELNTVSGSLTDPETPDTGDGQGEESTKTIYSMWQELSKDERRTMVTLAMTESQEQTSQDSCLSDDLKALQVEPLPANPDEESRPELEHDVLRSMDPDVLGSMEPLSWSLSDIPADNLEDSLTGDQQLRSLYPHIMVKLEKPEVSSSPPGGALFMLKLDAGDPTPRTVTMTTDTLKGETRCGVRSSTQIPRAGIVVEKRILQQTACEVGIKVKHEASDIGADLQDIVTENGLREFTIASA